MLNWYCVRARVAIRVEDQVSGMQTIEDRFLVVRAASCTDAEQRLLREWREYATPYLNSDGYMVSWCLEEVVDVYHTGEAELDPTGAEVYSRLAQRRMRPAFVWRPRRK